MDFKSLRIKANLTQAEAAKKIGVHQTAIAAWENGRSFPRLNKIRAICEVYMCSVSELISMHDLYHGPLDGNGYLDDLMEKLRALPVRD